jgi:hypothetical protein
MAFVGIVGHEAAKFTPQGRARAIEAILSILEPGDTVVSGGCHLGGVDIWAEEAAAALGLGMIIYTPTRLTWEPGPGYIGFKERNISIATASEIVHVIVVKSLPGSFQGMKHDLCYHCNVTSHIKSGGCWTGKHAQGLGKPSIWWEIDNGHE